ncbi:MAG: hypothetical protein IT214_03770 [Chitinophagaceae bacterium]|jgi:cell division protein FtsB|nr:hypothetical protein [Chitinophagaceae bacterium]OQY95773.1 MAG: hypothetical protein B6D37_04775 [Sphingobacteriales bacterium UTBCD1]
MKRGSLFLLFLSFFFSVVHAQAYETTIEYSKKKQNAYAIEYPYSADALQNAIVSKIGKMGYKGKEEKGLFNKDKGFIVFKSAYINDISSDALDYIVKVEQKSRKDKNTSVLYMVVNKNGEDASAGFDASEGTRIKNFLESLQPEVAAADLELQIKVQEDVMAKAEKKLRNLKDDQDSMEKKIKNLQDDLKKNAKDQDNAQKDIDNQKAALDALKAKRTSNN